MKRVDPAQRQRAWEEMGRVVGEQHARRSFARMKDLDLFNMGEGAAIDLLQSVAKLTYFKALHGSKMPPKSVSVDKLAALFKGILEHVLEEAIDTER